MHVLCVDALLDVEPKSLNPVTDDEMVQAAAIEKFRPSDSAWTIGRLEYGDVSSHDSYPLLSFAALLLHQPTTVRGFSLLNASLSLVQER